MPSVGKEWHTFKIVGGVKYQVRHTKEGWQTRLLYQDGTETSPMNITDKHGTRLWIGIKRDQKKQ